MLAVATYNESKGSEHQTGLQGTDTLSNPPNPPIPSECLHGPVQKAAAAVGWFPFRVHFGAETSLIRFLWCVTRVLSASNGTHFLPPTSHRPPFLCLVASRVLSALPPAQPGQGQLSIPLTRCLTLSFIWLSQVSLCILNTEL